MPNKTLSVREDDLPLWERAERAARQARTTVSALVATALATYLGDTDTITVPMHEERFGEIRHEQFAGRWLVGPHLDSSEDPDQYQERTGPAWAARFGHAGAPAEWRVGVAETARGRIAVYLHHWNNDYDQPPELHVFDSMAAARKGMEADRRVPAHLWREAADALDRGPAVVWRDI